MATKKESYGEGYGGGQEDFIENYLDYLGGRGDIMFHSAFSSQERIQRYMCTMPRNRNTKKAAKTNKQQLQSVDFKYFDQRQCNLTINDKLWAPKTTLFMSTCCNFDN